MLTKVGIKTEVVTMPGGVYFTRGTKREFSMGLFGLGAFNGEPSDPMKTGLATYNMQLGFGSANRGRYSNGRFDDRLEQALVTVDDDKRRELLLEATEIVIGDLGFIPLHHEVSSWATRKGLKYRSRTDEQTLVEEVSKEE